MFTGCRYIIPRPTLDTGQTMISVEVFSVSTLRAPSLLAIILFRFITSVYEKNTKKKLKEKI
jgi:hypothetical protein